MTPAQTILNCWNEQKPRGRLKRHRKLDPNMLKAISENIREGWSLEDMCEAIINFCAACGNKDTIWGNNSKYSVAVQRWGLFEFLHRGCKDDEKGKRWVKFTDNNWKLDDWLTRGAVQKRIESRRLEIQGTEILKEMQPRVSYKNLSEQQLVQVYNKANRFEKKIIKLARPEILKLF